MKELRWLREEPNSHMLFFFHFFFFFMCFVLFVILVQRLRAALAMVKKNLREHTGAREKAINPSLSGLRPTPTSHAK